MNQKTLILYLILLACVLFNTESIKRNHLTNQFKQRMHHKFYNLFHKQDGTETATTDVEQT